MSNSNGLDGKKNSPYNKRKFFVNTSGIIITKKLNFRKGTLIYEERKRLNAKITRNQK